MITGIGIAYLINLATYSVTGHIIDFQFHPALTFGAFFMGLLTIVIAGVGASGTSVARAVGRDAAGALARRARGVLRGRTWGHARLPARSSVIDISSTVSASSTHAR